MTRALPVLLFAVLATGARGTHARPASGGHDADTLAWVGERAITGGDLIRRIEWMPWPEKDAALMDSAKVRALESLVGEALLARDTTQAAADSLAIAPTRVALRRALMRDALYREVTSGVPVPARERVERELARRYPRASAAERPGLRRQVADSLQGFSIETRAAEFLVAHLAGQRVVVDSLVFLALSDSLRALALANPDSADSNLLPPDAPDALLLRLAPLLAHPLARMPGGPLALRDAIEDLRLYPFVIRARTRMGFARELNERLKTLIEGEMMAREAARRGLDSRPDVRADLARWTDAWLVRRRILRIASADPARAAQAVDRHVAALALRTSVRMEPARLRRIPILTANMVTKRRLGYGGGMLAAPTLTPLWGWVRIWREAHPVLP
jgi:hypothetical protein